MRVWIAYVLESYSPELEGGQFLIWRRHASIYAEKGVIRDFEILIHRPRFLRVEVVGRVIGLGYADFKNERDLQARLVDVCLKKLREVLPEEAERIEKEKGERIDGTPAH